MSENNLVINEILKLSGKGRKLALATVVKVTGSAYKREGSKMLIDDKGGTYGVISGGCLERDVTEVALQVMDNGQPVLKTYHLDEDLVWGLGLGCPGTVDIYIEPIKTSVLCNLNVHHHERLQPTNRLEPFQAWINCLQEKQACVLATVMNTSTAKDILPGTRIFISDHKSQVGQFVLHELNQIVSEMSYQKMNQQSPKSEICTVSLSTGEWVDVFLDVNVPAFELIIFGAGQDAIPLAKLGSQVGFKTTVVDPRPAYATAERFPGTRIIRVDAEMVSAHVEVGPRSYIVIMNHHLERDQASLEFALKSNSPYVGMLGPRTRCNKILSSIQINDPPFHKLHNPVGLDIGAESPEEIALSILSEIIAVRNRHAGGFLRSRKGIESNKIHQPI